MLTIVYIPEWELLTEHDILCYVRRIVEADLHGLANGEQLFDWDIFCKIEEMWTFFDPEYLPTSPNWAIFRRPVWHEMQELEAAIDRGDFQSTSRLVRELASKAGVLR